MRTRKGWTNAAKIKDKTKQLSAAKSNFSIIRHEKTGKGLTGEPRSKTNDMQTSFPFPALMS